MKSRILCTDLTVSFPITRKGPESLISSLITPSKSVDSFYALDHINLDIVAGTRLALLGPNGAGKSTLLKVLAGLLPPSSGSLSIDGDPFPALNPAVGIKPFATGLQNIALQGMYYGFKGETLESYVSEAKKIASLGDFINAPYQNLSSGMKSRLAIAMYSMVRPTILFMDEWIGTADKEATNSKTGLFNSLVSNTEIFVLASHNSKIIREHCNTGLVISAGAIEFMGDISDAIEVRRLQIERLGM